jgi:hypothetical protein
LAAKKSYRIHLSKQKIKQNQFFQVQFPTELVGANSSTTNQLMRKINGSKLNRN